MSKLKGLLLTEGLHGMISQVEGLAKALDLEYFHEKIENLKKDIDQVKAHPTSQYNPGWNAAIDLSNIIIASEAVAKSALIRQESRGGHTRLDFPEETNGGLEYNVVIRKGENNKMETIKETRKDAPEKLSKIAHASLEDLEEKNE